LGPSPCATGSAGGGVKWGQLFPKLGREISVAAREGGANPEGNSRLRLAIDRAREANMPMDTIRRCRVEQPAFMSTRQGRLGGQYTRAPAAGYRRLTDDPAPGKSAKADCRARREPVKVERAPKSPWRALRTGAQLARQQQQPQRCVRAVRRLSAGTGGSPVFVPSEATGLPPALSSGGLRRPRPASPPWLTLGSAARSRTPSGQRRRADVRGEPGRTARGRAGWSSSRLARPRCCAPAARPLPAAATTWPTGPRVLLSRRVCRARVLAPSA
jgi:Transcriptional regulator